MATLLRWIKWDKIDINKIDINIITCKYIRIIMPSPTYQHNKKSIYTWRSKNVERNREINKQAKRKIDLWKKIQKVYLAILLI